MADPSFEHYVDYRDLGDGVLRPILEAEVICNDIPARVRLLLDTGADNVVLARRLIPYFELDEANCTIQEAFTLSGLVQAVIGPAITIRFPELWPTEQFQSEVVFGGNLDNKQYDGLLGREPTLNHITCRFGHRWGSGIWLHHEP